MNPLPPLGLYVHYPWCVRKCPYCDFNSHGLRGELPARAYTDALLTDLERELATSGERPIETVFFGGGTPSLVEPAQVARIIECLRDHRRLAAAAEITLEANPGTADSERFAGYRDAGVTRLSIGVQSFDDAALGRLGRVHDAHAARAAVEKAHAAGFERINIDLMYGLPGQDVDAAVRDARLACELEPGHISHYQLTIEPNTVFHRYPPALPDDDGCWAMHEQTAEVFAAAGYRRYEVSALARRGQRCRHNLNYWRFGDYIGVGAGAHGKLSSSAGVMRSVRPKSPTLYMQAVAAGAMPPAMRLAAPDLAFEFMLNALRLPDGFPPALFTSRTGLALDAVARPLREGRRRGLLRVATHRIGATPLGQRFLDDLQALFLPPETGAHAIAGG